MMITMIYEYDPCMKYGIEIENNLIVANFHLGISFLPLRSSSLSSLVFFPRRQNEKKLRRITRDAQEQ